MMSTDREPDGPGEPDGPPGIPYTAAWWIGTVITVLLGIWAVLSVAIGTHTGPPMPAGLEAWLPYIAAGLAIAGRFFPSQQHTVGNRVKQLRRALGGVLPTDVPRNHPEMKRP